jgi:hypothetical protein
MACDFPQILCDVDRHDRMRITHSVHNLIGLKV